MERDLQVVLWTSEIITYCFQSPRKVLPPNEKQDSWSSAIPLVQAHSTSMTPEMSSHKNIPSFFPCISKENKIRFTVGIVAVKLSMEVLLFLHSICEV